MTNRPKIIFDTDPGGDDILALLWLQSLVKQGYAELIAVTTVEGNVSAKSTFTNASQVLGLLGSKEIPVARSVVNKHQDIPSAEHIHGRDGMGGLSQRLLPPSHDFATAPTADDVIIDALTRQPGEITLVAIAPLTNLAAAEKKQPGILKLAKEIVIMGGAFTVAGNISPHAEFNIAYDGEAAKIVFHSRNDLVIIPLDITHQLIFSAAMVKDLVTDMVTDIGEELPSFFLWEFIRDLSNFMSKTSLSYRETAGKFGFLVHDAATIAYLFYPQTLTWQRAKVEVETQGEFTKGKTFFDKRYLPTNHANAWVGIDVDSQNLLASLVADLRYLIREGVGNRE